MCSFYRLRTNATAGSDADKWPYRNRSDISWPLCYCDSARLSSINQAYSDSDTTSHQTTGLPGDRTAVFPNSGIARSVANAHHALPDRCPPASDYTQCTDWEWDRNLIGCFTG